MDPSPHTLWTNLQDEDISVQNVQDILTVIDDDLWVAAACFDRLLNDVEVQRSLLELGISRTAKVVQRVQHSLSLGDSGAESDISSWFKESPVDAQLCRIRLVLLERLDRLNTFVEICKESPRTEADDTDMDIDEEWEDDPWAGENAGPSSAAQKTKSMEPPIPLTEFLVENMAEIACFFASQEYTSALRILMLYHTSILWPFRFTILDNIPGHTHPSEYRDILPAYDVNSDAELDPPSNTWREYPDWVETVEVKVAILESFEDEEDNSAFDGSKRVDPLPVEHITQWYKRRVDYVITSTGMIDLALATIQHGASQGVPDLDELGEELSLLSRLVYDAPYVPDADADNDWTLSRWRSMDPASVVQAYLAHSTPTTVAKDISRLVIPYLFVLEARAERASQPEHDLHNRLLYEYILSTPLNIAAAIFEASKPTSPAAQRLIRNDEDLARLALACLYGSDSRNEWPTMSRIFECLPVWDINPDSEDEADETDSTIISLGAFVTPSTIRPRCTPSDLFFFFKPLPLVSLSRALDILDVHLEAGEILSRWNVAAPLRWFLQSTNDVVEQRAWANRMARRVGSPSPDMGGLGDWDWLLDDMLKLTGPNENGIRSAFGLLSPAELSSIFFGGVLSSGKFDIAKNLLYKGDKLALDHMKVEEVCLSISREFYDNASSGNYKFGDMKLAYDCLDVPSTSDRLIREKEFIEATSRLSSFNVMSRPGIPISPIEVRLTKDRLSLISRVLSSNSDAYKHTQVILDLLHKLGFRDDRVAEVKTLAMLADTALQAEDFTRAFETSDAMISAVLKLRSSVPPGVTDAKVQEVSEVCWIACFQLGRQPEFLDIEKKLLLLGRALELCPADKINDVLTSWRQLEKEDLQARRDRLAHRSTSPHKRPIAQKTASSLQARLHDLHMTASPLMNAEDAAALASRTFNRVASNFPFTVGSMGRSVFPQDDGRSHSRDDSRHRFDGEEVSTQASRVLQKGIGWLLGADEG
ncbi:secretory pathway protein Sec39-domain-containing protein [Hygrophoropsis aurantiaca]|uniref:Secretory pathway protein Sec39-domain-containing protein n=1 Tax=Hygrophoropsis aurantiaca TaxID=72124 RepID=A0ACB8AHB3_9AGAM|nr:secretory pathway protein Sec39-domain-containing protein [Hygrophoropsis aurantiaca]